MYLKLPFSILLFFLFISLYAQQEYICINDQIQLKESKGLNSSVQAPEFQEIFSTKYINTVVHVIYNEAIDSIPREIIEAAIEDLNRLFRAEGIDTSLINPVHRSKIKDSFIQFCLSKTDPNGEPATGITYTRTDVDGFPIQFSLNGITAELVKNEFFGGVAPWDVDLYFNIWIAPVGVNNENFSYGIPRDEYYPLNNYTPANTIPGALIDVDNFNAPPPIGTLETLFAHECGHALGLLHTFHIQGIDTIEFCDGTDFMMDTPTAAPTTECDPSFTVNTCVAASNDEPDHVANFMNYACQQMFTPDQIATMQNNLSLAPSGLYEEAVCETISSTEDVFLSTEFEFVIAPNPNNGNFVLRFPQPSFSVGTALLYNSMGQILFEEKVNLSKSLSFQINRPGLENGIYYLRIKSSQGDALKRIIIQEK